jgi:hypothetical protein
LPTAETLPLTDIVVPVKDVACTVPDSDILVPVYDGEFMAPRALTFALKISPVTDKLPPV